MSKIITGNVVNVVMTAVMPKGVEHPTLPPMTSPAIKVMTAVMPKGFEHTTIHRIADTNSAVMTAVMPKGVEHALAALNVRAFSR